jgi:hypothetical protein
MECKEGGKERRGEEREGECCLDVLKIRLNYKLYPLTLVKIQFSPLNFDRIN